MAAFALALSGRAASAAPPHVASPTASATSCSADTAAGLPLPRAARGACAVASGDGGLLVQRSDEGLFVAALAALPAEAALADGSRHVELDETAARVIFCPASLLDFATGAPGRDCLLSARPLVPGPGALAGTGSLRGDLRVDASGGAVSPSVVTIAGDLGAPGGEAVALRGSIGLIGEPGQPAPSGAAYTRIDLTARGERPVLTTNAPPVPAAERSRRIAQLQDLNAEQWQVVEFLAALTPRDWSAVEALVRDASVSGPGGAHPLPVAPPAVVPTSIAELLNTILARINSVGTNAESLLSRTPDRPDVRAIVGDVNVARVRDLIDPVRDVIQGLIDIATELRDGYETFDAAQFRVRLGRVLDDLQTATAVYDRLLCVEDPDHPVRELPLAAPVKRLIDHAPGVVLYAMSKILDTVDPQWDQQVAGILDAIPSDVTGLCNEGATMHADRLPDFENAVCKVLRRKVVGSGLRAAKVLASAGLVVARIVKNHTKEEIAATAGVEVVAGATGGTAVKNPVHVAAESWADRLDHIKEALKDGLDRRKDCLDADKDIESDLRDCAKDDCACLVPLTVVLPGDAQPTYAYVADLVAARITQAQSAGFPHADDARVKHDAAVGPSTTETAEGYGLLCQAYRDLLPATATTPIDPRGGRGRPSWAATPPHGH